VSGEPTDEERPRGWMVGNVYWIEGGGGGGSGGNSNPGNTQSSCEFNIQSGGRGKVDDK
jgi:hypothetical protein